MNSPSSKYILYILIICTVYTFVKNLQFKINFVYFFITIIPSRVSAKEISEEEIYYTDDIDPNIEIEYDNKENDCTVDDEEVEECIDNLKNTIANAEEDSKEEYLVWMDAFGGEEE